MEQGTDRILELEKNAAIKEKLVACIKGLEEKDRLIISLYYYENLGYAEIAKIMGLTVSRVSRIHAEIINKMKETVGF